MPPADPERNTQALATAFPRQQVRSPTSSIFHASFESLGSGIGVGQEQHHLAVSHEDGQSDSCEVKVLVREHDRWSKHYVFETSSGEAATFRPRRKVSTVSGFLIDVVTA
jgi:hypothetical protein